MTPGVPDSSLALNKSFYFRNMQIRSTIFDLTPAEQIKMLGTKQVDRLYRTPRRTASW